MYNKNLSCGVILMSESVAKVGELYGSTVPRSLYDREKELRETYERVISEAVAIEIETLREQNSQLMSERDLLRGKVEQSDKLVGEIKKAYDIKVRQVERQAETVRQQSLSDQRKNIKSKNLRPLEIERDNLKEQNQQLMSELEQLKAKWVESETLLKSRDEEIERLQTIEFKLDTLSDVMTDKLDCLIEMIKSGRDTSEIVETVEQIKSTMTTKPDVESECRLIHQLINEGKTQRDIAKIVFPGVARGEAKVSERKKSKTWLRLFGDM